MKNKLWFTADTHFGHKNILTYANRPFDSIEKMDEVLITNWNNKISESDDVYHLGDVALCGVTRMKEILSKLKGRIHLIRGNHEKSAEACYDKFIWIKDYYELYIEDIQPNKKLIVLFHYPLRIWNASHHGSYHLYGHSHGQLQEDKTSLSLDVGVDCHSFAPLSYEDVVSIMLNKDWQPPVLRNL